MKHVSIWWRPVLRPSCRFHAFCVVVAVVLFLRGEWASGDEPRPSATVAVVTVVKTSVVKTGESAVEVRGRVIVEAQDGGLLLEDAAHRIHTLTKRDVVEQVSTQQPFQYLSDDDLAAQLLRIAGANFSIRQTEHFTICSDASDVYTSFCGKLLEKVLVEYLEFFEEAEFVVKAPDFRLPVVIFRDSLAFQEHARQQHPETDFSTVPGYYSIRDNQMFIAGLSGDREFRSNGELIRELRKHPRQVETIVHESIHQLTFNTGVMVRYADNSMWLSEGLAVYFEQASGRGATFWNRPGEPSGVHLPGLKATIDVRSGLGLPLADLIASDQPFLSANQLADAYGESWALTHFLITSHRKGFDQLLQKVSHQQPLHAVTAENRLKNFAEATNLSAEEAESGLIRHVSRLRLR